MADIVVGDFVRWGITGKPPPDIAAEVNNNSAMVVTAISVDERGGTITVARQGKHVGTYPVSLFVEVRAP